MYKVKDFLTSEFLDWFMEIFPQTAAMILNLSDEELKAEAVKVNDIVDMLCSLYRLTSRSDSPEVVDKFRLELALKGLRSPYLERRLTGLGDINEFVEVTSFIPYQRCAVGLSAVLWTWAAVQLAVCASGGGGPSASLQIVTCPSYCQCPHTHAHTCEESAQRI
jgi:hypothetical protein